MALVAKEEFFMAYCVKCGKSMPDNATFCPSCGARRMAEEPVVVPDSSSYTMPQANTGYTAPQVHPMKYYKFVIWVQLFLSAVVGVSQGILLLTGRIYETVSDVSAKLLYAFYPGMHTVNILFGLIYIALAVAAIYVRQQLAHFKTKAPDLYYIYLIAQMAATFLYGVLQNLIIASGLGSAVPNLIVMIILLVLCRIYFEKRRALFCN